MLARYFVLLLGTAFILAGVGGFVPGVTQPPPPEAPTLSIGTSYGLLLGLFPINLVHNLIHFGFGVWGLAAYRTETQSRMYTRAMALILTLFTVMGLLPGLSTTFGLLPLFGHDIWLHGLEAVIAIYLGWFYTPAPRLTTGA